MSAFPPTSRPGSRPDIGKRLLPVEIDRLAIEEPDRPWASIPFDDQDLSKGFEDISYATFANAINRLAWVIEESFGKSSNFGTIAYFGLADIRYHMVQMAVCKTGWKVLFSSHLNSLPVHLHLMEKSECSHVLFSNGCDIDDLLASRSMKSLNIPDFNDLLYPKSKSQDYPYTKTFEEASQDPYLLLHSSGTTGLPKIVPFNHAIMATVDNQNLLPPLSRGHPILMDAVSPGEGKRFLGGGYPYHAMSAAMALCSTVFGGGVYIPGLRQDGPSPDNFPSLLEHARADTAFLTPWVMEHIARMPNAEYYLKRLKRVIFGGAILSDFAAKVWTKHCDIFNGWSTTELLSVPLVEGSKEDTSYIFFNRDFSGIDFRPVETDFFDDNGERIPIFEAYVCLTPESAPYTGWAAREGIMPTSAPPYPERATGDLFTPHPDPAKAFTGWKFAGRNDELISLSSGINLHPAPMERIVTAHPQISAALVVGMARNQPLMIIELAAGASQVDTLDLWEKAVEPMNRAIVSHGYVPQSHTLIFPANTFVRTPKGSIMRRHTIQKLKDKIDAVYEEHGDSWQGRDERPERTKNAARE